VPFREKHFLGILIGLVFANELRENRLVQIRNLFQTRFLKKFLLFLGGLFLISAALIPLDSVILHWVIIHGGPESPVTYIGIWVSKNSWKILIWLYILGFLLRSRVWKKFIFGAALSNGLTSVIATLFKFTLMRARPDNHLGPLSFFNLQGLQNQSSFQSFPSGDVSIVAGACGYFFFAVKNPFAKLLFFLIPFTTAYARLSANRHWPTDTLFSVGLGFLVAYWVSSHQEKPII